MTLDLEDRLWEQLEAAADREAARGRVARGAASARTALPRWKLRAAAPLAAGAAVVVLLLVALAPDRPQPQWRVDRFGVTGADLGTAVAGHGALWSYDRQSRQLLRLDPRTHRVVVRVVLPVPAGDVSLASGAGAVWAVTSAAIRHSAPAPAHPPPGELVRVDPRTDRVAARVLLRAPDGATLLPVDVVALPDAVWVWGESGAQRIDPRRNRVTAAISPRGERVLGFAATDERASFFTDLGRLVTFDARTGERLGAVALDGPLGGEDLVAVGHGVVAYRQGGELVNVDTITGRDRWAARVGSRPRDVTVVGDKLWLLMADPGARTNELRALVLDDGHVAARVALPADDGHMIAPAGETPVVTTQSGDLITVRPPR